MRHQLFLGLISVFTAAATTLPGSCAPSAEGGTSQQFSLSAQMTERPQLSRSDVDNNAVVKIAPTQPPRATLTYADVAKPPAFAKPPKTATSPAQPSGGDAPLDGAQVAMLEKNVNWSGWVSQLADRWYYVLHQFENGADMQFITQRPALFEFTCYANGQIGNVSLRQSSGNIIYDHLQMIALMQATPLAPFPQGTKRTSITLLQGWESHVKQPGESDYVPGSFGKNFPMEKVREWVKAR